MANKLRPEPMPSATNALMDAIGRFYENDGLAGLLGMASVNRQIHDATQAQMAAPNVRAGVAAAVDNPMTMAVGPATIRAYHGSPHSFDKFDLSKIGTGEGAQAYGHGLYFAENEGVARQYRDTLAPGKITDQYGSVPADPWYDIARAAQIAEPTGKDFVRANKIADQVHTGLRNGDDIGHMRKFVAQSDWPADEKGIWSAALDAASKFRAEKSPGSMYEVNLHADPAALLDWDKPLAGQSPKVQGALSQFDIRPGGAAERAQYLDSLPQNLRPLAEEMLSAPTVTGDAAMPSWERLVKGAPDIDHNAIHDIRRAAERPQGWGFDTAPPTGDDLYRAIAAAPQASQLLNQSGVPGIKYLDGGSRGAGTGTSNYVMFDPARVEILRKYGLLPAAAVGAGAASAADAALVPVDHDPFGAPLVPVDHDPFGGQ